MNIVRESKFRFVFGDLSKPEFHITNVILSNLTGDQTYIVANTKYFAVPIGGGGGPIFVCPIDKGVHLPIASELACLVGHKGRILDLDFDPFNEERLATACEDSTIRVWEFPDGGPKENISEALVLQGHTRKVLNIQWSPVAKNVLVSAGGDYHIKIWDVEKLTCNLSLTSITEFVQALGWNSQGDKVVISSKDKMIRVWEPITNTVSEFLAHESVRTCKCCWAGQYVVTTGFSKLNSREIKLWDPTNPAEPLACMELDRSSGCLFPYFDDDLKLLYVMGKGDNCVSYFELTDSAPYLYFLNKYNYPQQMKGLAFCPKRMVDVLRCEIAHCVILSLNSVEPLSFIVPRRCEGYQEDLYPPCIMGKSNCEANEWFMGTTRLPSRISLNPLDKNVITESSTVVEKKTYQQLETELEEARKRIAELELELANSK